MSDKLQFVVEARSKPLGWNEVSDKLKFVGHKDAGSKKHHG